MMKKMILATVIAVLALAFTACSWQEGKEVSTEATIAEAVATNEEISKEPELSDAQKELEELYEKKQKKTDTDTDNNMTYAEVYLLVEHYNIPTIADFSPETYSFSDRMDLYLTSLERIVEEEEGEFDFLYRTISNQLIDTCHVSKKEMSEADCVRALDIISLCEERLKTAKVWGTLEVQEEEREDQIQLTDTRKELEILYNERGTRNTRSKRETKFLMSHYDIPFLEDEPLENSFEQNFDSYLDKVEELAENEGEWDLLYEDLSDSLIWKYDSYKYDLTEEQCQRMLELIELCKEQGKTAKVYGED